MSEPVVFISHFAVKGGHARRAGTHERGRYRQVMGGMRAMAERFGVPLVVEPAFNAGFLRLESAPRARER